MDRPPLPDPKTPGDRYLHDIATSLRQLVDRESGRDVELDPETGVEKVRLQEPAVDLDGMLRDDLNAYARRVGVKEPQALPNKDAVKRAIRERG